MTGTSVSIAGVAVAWGAAVDVATGTVVAVATGVAVETAVGVTVTIESDVWGPSDEAIPALTGCFDDAGTLPCGVSSKPMTSK